ncbi:hypothetical protein DL762_001893 [Monosporascus cannonballus]|uniref:Uncharacterized protein n=1 Tax=Monosporascus cannonballus TaxID=155416 RepID=A0ABY0HF12_9PEZI|nr:hypothetical protein DL762_001893 [Monosporascus cannonballus]
MKSYHYSDPYDADVPLDSKHVRSWTSQHAPVTLLTSFGKFDPRLLGLWIMGATPEESTTLQSAGRERRRRGPVGYSIRDRRFSGPSRYRGGIGPGDLEVTDHGLLYQREKGNIL